jgi:hypothetical protein
MIDEDWIRGKSKSLGEHSNRKKVMSTREKEDLELERLAMELEAAIGRLSELGKKQESANARIEQLQTTDGLEHMVFGPTQQGDFGSSIEDLFSHSYQKPVTHKWVWAPRARVLEAAKIGFPVTRGEVRRFGDRARHIQPVAAKNTDTKSFVEVTRERAMENRGGGRGPYRGGCNTLGVKHCISIPNLKH